MSPLDARAVSRIEAETFAIARNLGDLRVEWASTFAAISRQLAEMAREYRDGAHEAYAAAGRAAIRYAQAIDAAEADPMARLEPQIIALLEARDETEAS